MNPFVILLGAEMRSPSRIEPVTVKEREGTLFKCLVVLAPER